MKKKYLSKIIFALIVVAFIICCMIQAPISEAVGSLWSLLPPIVAIGLALITKEVYSSLFIGILTGGVLYSVSTSGGFPGMFKAVVQDGLIANIADSYNVGILVFLVVLGIIVVLMNKAGGSRAYGEWASAHIKTRAGASLATFLLGVLIFVDDYFNCLTVGSVMRPVTDKHKISRSKLAYLIDATAAPVCIIAPISSWAAAVSGTVDGVNGIQLFIRTIPYNLYAILTLIMVVFIALSDTDYGPMKIHENNAKNGDLFTTRSTVYAEDDGFNANGGSGDAFGGGGPGFGGHRGGESSEAVSGSESESGEMPVPPDTDSSEENAQSTSDSADEETYISISGGKITIIIENGRDADGLDSNGDILISGGTILISLPGSSGNCAVDYASENGGTASISGGTIIACGDSSMAEGFDASSAQASVLYNISTAAEAGTTLSLKDAEGNVLLTWDVPCSFSSALISCPQMQVGSTYKVVIGESEEEITLEEVSSSFGEVQGGMFGGNMDNKSTKLECHFSTSKYSSSTMLQTAIVSASNMVDSYSVLPPFK